MFARVSFDLIYARQGQELAAWRAELARALALAGDHLSLYQLTIEPGTRFGELAARGRLRGLPDADLAADDVRASRRRSAPRPGCRPTRSRTTRAPGRSAGTTSSTGATATMPASGPARTGG